MPYVNIQQKIKHLIFSGRVTNEAKTQKLTIFRNNLFGNFYSTLNFLSNGIQYLSLFSCQFFNIFFTKYKTPPVAVLKIMRGGNFFSECCFYPI